MTWLKAAKSLPRRKTAGPVMECAPAAALAMNG
jgi:hypothetical protein